MSGLAALLSEINELFAAAEQPWALVGGVAVSVRTEPRFTRDLDLAVAVSSDRDAETVVFGLRSKGFRVKALVEQETTRRLATARLLPARQEGVGLLLDLLFASSGIEQEVCAEAELLEVFPGLSIPVARLHHLMVLKALARDDRTRPQDAVDLRALVKASNSDDFKMALEYARLVEQRGFNRSRDLQAALREAWTDYKCPPAATGRSQEPGVQ